MPLSRRSFLKSGTVAGLSAAFVLEGASSVLSKNQNRPNARHRLSEQGAQRQSLRYFTREDFEPHVNSIFQAPNVLGQMVRMRLTDVSDYKPQASTRIMTTAARDCDCFSLMFSARRRLPQSTSTHKVSHPQLGKFDLFLTNHGEGNGTFFYGAVFNRAR